MAEKVTCGMCAKFAEHLVAVHLSEGHKNDRVYCNAGKPDKGGGTYVHASMDATGSPCFVKRNGKTEYEKFYGRKK